MYIARLPEDYISVLNARHDVLEDLLAKKLLRIGNGRNFKSVESHKYVVKVVLHWLRECPMF